MRTQYKAFCFASGDIKFGLAPPAGSVVIAQGPYRELKEAVETLARHGYEKGVLLVPGVPEATSVEDAIAAVVGFVAWARGDREHSMWRCPGEVSEELKQLVSEEV